MKWLREFALLPVAFIAQWMDVNRYDIINVERHSGIIFNLNFIKHETHLLNFFKLKKFIMKNIKLMQK